MIETLERVIRETERERNKKKKLEDKLKDQTFQMAFCGHFSAGKSTLLNQLVGTELLPTSPIPTSANIICIQHGQLGLKIQSQNGEWKEWEGEIPWEQVRKWGMNGVDIQAITIQAPLPFLNEKSMIYDTPGVDSTDPTHQEVTFEALQETDVIVYVMEYNHVQSETNLLFLKQLTDENKPIYIVINQIDKHDESELSFQSFDHSIRETLHNWGIRYIELHYTSMKAPHHHLNEWSLVKKQLQSLLFYSKQFIPLANKRLLQGYYLRKILRLQDDCHETMEQIKEEMEANGYHPNELEERKGLIEQLEEMENAKTKLEEDLTNKFNDLVKNITLFPYTTTELTRQWLEVMDPSYRAGWLFAKKKTEKVREEYINRLIHELEDKIKSLLVFHLQTIFRSYPLTQLSNRSEVEKEIEQLSISLDADFFSNSVQKGPKDRNYVFTYTKDRTEAIIAIFRKKTASIIRLITNGMEEYWNREKAQIEKRVSELQSIEQFVDKMEEIQEEYNKMIRHYELEVETYKDGDRLESKLKEVIQQAPPTFEEHDWGEVTLPEDSVIATNEQENLTTMQKPLDEQAMMNLVDKVQEYGREPGHPVVEDEKKSLIKRVNRFKNRSFTISLFGAFSAGKSSFANALLGESILPVSPNPTTATVNIVRQSDEEHRDQTAMIQMKSEITIQKEIEFVAKQLELDLSFETIHKWNPKRKKATTKWQKTYYAYLEMLQKALKEKQRFELGELGSVSLAEVAPFIAKEENACLVEKVTIFYDCPLTKSGVILVDTPGVNSIHGRHTQVAFKQVQQSDAIFYVTYYNHSFSKADQLFLQQMAKVNEGFREDKLYFVLNAADLAHSQAELNGVRNHVLDQLKMNGFQNPRLFSLSSKQGLRGKQEGTFDTDFQQFESAFYTHTIHDIIRLSFRLLVEEMERYKHMLTESIHFIEAEASQKEAKQAELKANIGKWKKDISNTSYELIIQHCGQEFEQLFVYLRERIRYQLNDYYQDCVNVTTVLGDTKREQKASLRAALVEWMNEGEHFIKQELQATIIRVDAKIKQTLDQWIESIYEQVKINFPSLSVPTFNGEPLTIDFSKKTFLQFEVDSFSQQFHSLRRFFEEGENRRLKEQVVAFGTEYVQKQLRNNEVEARELVNQYIDQSIQEVKQLFYQKLEREWERLLLLVNDTELDQLKNEVETISQFIKESETISC